MPRPGRGCGGALQFPLCLVDDAKVGSPLQSTPAPPKVGSPLQANGLGEITLVVTTPLGMVVNHADNNTGMVVSRLALRGNASTAGVTPGMLVKAINGVDTRSLTIKAFMEHVKNTPQGGEVHLVLTDPSNMYGAVQVFTETYDAPAANTAGAEHYADANMCVSIPIPTCVSKWRQNRDSRCVLHPAECKTRWNSPNKKTRSNPISLYASYLYA